MKRLICRVFGHTFLLNALGPPMVMHAVRCSRCGDRAWADGAEL